LKHTLILLSILLSLLIPSLTASQPLNPVIKRPFLSSVSVTDSSGNIIGSGVIIDRKCKLQVLTAAHVIEYMQKKKKNIYVLSPIRFGLVPMKVIKIDSNIDLALLSGIKKTKTTKNIAVRLAVSMPLLGDTVWMISSPSGHHNIITKGILSHLLIHKRKGKTKKILLFGTTATGFFASSGGGLFNKNGDLIGIFHMIISTRFGVLPGGYYSVSLPHIVNFLK